MMSTYDNETGSLPPQFQLQQHYIIIGQAGKGGMGAVYQAIDIRNNSRRRVAIKEMSQGHLSETELREASAQFQREATMLGRLSHPNLPRIYDAFNEKGRSYLVMDFIDGKTLLQLLKESGNRPLPVLQVLDYAIQLCDVLAYLHQQQPPIIFRDLKPTNVMVTSDGHVYLIDFGIARFFKEGQAQDTVFLGSPGYAAPEQHGSAQTNPRSDLYSLGATLHCLLTGRDPYHAQDRFAFPPIRQYNPQVPIELDQLIQRLLAVDEQQRPASAIKVQQALTRIRQQATDDTRAISSGTIPTQYGSPAPALDATQYARPTPQSNQGPLILPPTAALPPSVPPIRDGILQASPPTAASAPTITRIWTPSFIALFVVMLVVTVGGSILAFNIPYPYGPGNIAGLDHAVEFGLSLLLLGITIYAGTLVRSLIPRVILVLTGLSVLLSGYAFAVQTLIDLHYLQLSDLNPLLATGLLATAVVSLLWLVRPFTSVDRIVILILFGAAAVCAVFQYLLSYDGDVTKHILLLFALIILLLGILVTGQMERVRARADDRQ